MAISRRRFTKVTFVGALAAASISGGAAIVNYLYPRNHDRRLKTFSLSASDVPHPGGTPLLNEEFGFYLVNLSHEDVRTRALGVDGPGLLALSTVCPRFGNADCPVRWEPDLRWRSPLSDQTELGWMRCPCDESMFTPAGDRVFGPAPRGLDTLRLERKGGRLYVHLTEVTERGNDAGVEPLPWP